MPEHELLERREAYRPRGARIDHEGVDFVGPATAHRHPELDVSEVQRLQRTVGNAATVQLLEEERSPVHDVIGSGGRALDAEVRTDMEARLGHDFSAVRVHDDAAAAASAAAVNAHAYTVGNDVVFQRDAYDPGSHAGRVTLAHELTHVIQQRSGPVAGTAAPGGISLSDPGDRFEREAAANAEQVMASPAPIQRYELEDELSE